MTIAPFNYDYWRDGQGARDSAAWREQGLHWHGYTWRGPASEYGNESARRDLASELPPKELTDWLRKPARCLRAAHATPEEMADWLRGQWHAVRDQLGQEATEIDEEARFGRALYDLRCGNTVCWGGWLGSSTVWHVAAVPTAAGCH